MLKIVFMGTPQFSVPILEALIERYDVVGVVTQPDKRVGRKQELVFSPVKECAMKHQIPVFQPEKIRKEYEDIIALNPDLIVTAAYGQIVGTKLLNYPKYHAINVHGSLLPKYRGGAPIQHAIMNGDKKTGITIMYMAKEMDAGDMLAKKELTITDEDTSGTIFEKLSYIGRDLLLEVIPKLISGDIIPEKQDETQVTFAYNITKEEEKLDFNKPSIQLFNQIRALNPNPIAYMMLGNDIIKVYKAALSNVSHQLLPGSIVSVTKRGFLMACGQNTCLEILEVQPSGKKVMKASDFANGALRKYMK
ncbi:MAG: methionyl-tRNA formyltransferase [Bacilli bacterium]